MLICCSCVINLGVFMKKFISWPMMVLCQSYGVLLLSMVIFIGTTSGPYQFRVFWWLFISIAGGLLLRLIFISQKWAHDMLQDKTTRFVDTYGYFPMQAVMLSGIPCFGIWSYFHPPKIFQQASDALDKAGL